MSASLIVTVVTPATDQLTAAGHGMTAGQRFRLRNVGGALPTASPSLAPVTDYFAIVGDANNVKVATSLANALAGTAVDITGTGSGTLFIEYGLPYCVPRIASAGTQVFSNDDNTAWQALVAMYDLLTGQAQSIFGGAVLSPAAEANVAPVATFRDWTGLNRSLVDHNGYRMGQVSEIDENWNVSPVTVEVPLAPALSTSGTWAYNSVDWTGSTSGTLVVPLGWLPIGAIITSVLVSYSKTVAGDTVTFNLFNTLLGSTVPTGAATISKAIATGTGNTTTDVLVSPTAGHGPKQVGFDGNPNVATDDTSLTVALTLTGSFSLHGIKVTYVLPPPGWTYSGQTLGLSATGDNLALVEPSANFNQRGVQLLGAASSIAGASVLTPNYETFFNTNVAYAIEFMVFTGVITDGSAHRLFQLGIQNNNAGAGNRFVSLYTDNTFANWQLQIVGSATLNTDTGVAVAANTLYRVRLELYGASLNSSGNVKARCYINGVKVAEVNVSTLPAADKIRPYFKVGTNGTTGGPYDVSIGRVRRAWNHLLAGDSL